MTRGRTRQGEWSDRQEEGGKAGGRDELNIERYLLVSKVASKGLVQHRNGRSDESPAAFTDRTPRAARADRVIIRHVDIEHELSSNWLQFGGWKGFFIARLRPADHGEQVIRDIVLTVWRGEIDILKQ